MTRRLVVVNSAWLIADKLVRLGMGLFVWLWLARLVGPQAFGTWNFAIAFAAMFAAVAGLGLDGVLQRELIAQPDRVDTLLGTAILLRFLAGVVAAIVCIATVAWLRPGDHMAAGLVAFGALAFVLQSSQVIDYHFQSRMNNRPAVLAVNAAFLLATLLRLALLWCDAPLLWFGATLSIEAAAGVGMLLLAYRADGMRLARWHARMATARHLLAASWPMLISSMAVMIYMRVDQVMLASMVGDAAVGQFSAALRISEVWYFVPMAIMSAAFPAMVSKREEGALAYERFVQRLYDGMAWLGLSVAVTISLITPWLIDTLYGPAYQGAAEILRVQVWAGITVAMSSVHGKWLLAEGLQRLGLVYTLVGGVVNITLNLLLIPRFGAVGAAWATLATQIGLMPMQLLFPRARRNFVLMLKTPLAPLRLALR